jgi:hypothetical protein
MNITRDEFNRISDIEVFIREKAKIILNELNLFDWFISCIYFCKDYVNVECSYCHCSNCGIEFKTIEFPFEYFLFSDDEIRKDVRIKKEKEKADFEEQLKKDKIKENLKRKKEEEANDLEEYARLKKKYEYTSITNICEE